MPKAAASAPAMPRLLFKNWYWYGENLTTFSTFCINICTAGLSLDFICSRQMSVLFWSARGRLGDPKSIVIRKTQHICNMDLKNRAHSHVLAPETKSTAPKHGSVGFFDIPTGLQSTFFGFLQYMDFGAPGAPRELKNRAPGVPGS